MKILYIYNLYQQPGGGNRWAEPVATQPAKSGGSSRGAA